MSILTKVGHFCMSKHKRARKRCRTKYGRKRAVDRSTTVETIFGEGKNQHGLARARFRGIKKVSIQFLMIAITQNIKRMVTCLQPSFSFLLDLINRVILSVYRFILTNWRKHYDVIFQNEYLELC